MKNEKIKEFLTKIAQEEGFKVEFLKLKEKVEKKGFSKKDNEKFISECLLPWSKKLGYKLSKKDFIDFDRMQKPTEITGLSPVELENVSGGGFTMLFALFAMFGSALAGGIGGGDSTNKNQKKGQDSCSTSLTQYQQADSGETTLAMLRDGHQINDIILDAYMHPQDGLPDSPAGSLDWDGYSQGAGTTRPTAPQGSTGIASMDYGIGETPADFGSGTAEGAGTTTPTAPQGSTGIASMDYYEANYGETPADFATGTAEGAGTTTPTAPQGSTGIASMDYYEANYGETPADFGSGAGKPMSTALVTTPGQPQTSVTDYNENFARSSAAVDSGENVVQMLKDIREGASAPAGGKPMSTAPEPKPAGDVFFPIKPSTWRESPASTDSVVSEQAHPGVPAPDFNITTGFAGGGTLVDAPLYNQTNTTQGNSTFNATKTNTTQGNSTFKATKTNATQGNPTFNATTTNTTQGTSNSSSTPTGQSWKDIVKGTAQMTGIAAGLGAAALGTVYTAASVASALFGDGAQQNASKTKETTAKTEDKKSTREAKKEESDFMRLFMENLQKNSPEASQYLNSLKY